MLEVEKQHMKRTQKQAAVNAAYDGDDEKDIEDKELASEWEQLRRHAKTHFPEGSEFVEITPTQKLVAIASVLGWSAKKISQACGKHERTVQRWLSEKEYPQVVYFADQYRIKTGKQDITELQNENIYRFMRFVNEVLSDPTDDIATKKLKLDVGKWNWEAVKGKPGQKIEHEGLDLKSVYEAIAGLDSLNLTEEEEKALFNEDTLN